MRRLILVPLFIVVACLAILGGVGYWIYNNYMYYGTDDAQVTGTIVSVNAPATGKLTTLNVALGQRVIAGQTIAVVTPASATVPTGAPTSTAKQTTLDITSPINGTILQVSAVEGQDVAPGLPVLQVADLGGLNVTAYVDENSVNNISNGQSVDITIDAYKDTKFTGHVQQIVPVTAGQFALIPTQDNASGNFTKVGQRVPVIITLDGTGGKQLMPGMSAEVTVHIH